MANQQLAPEPILRGALRVMYMAGVYTRNWTLTDEVPRGRINDLWEALHDIPALLCRWDEGAERRLLRYFDEYNEKWPEPHLRGFFDQAAGRSQ